MLFRKKATAGDQSDGSPTNQSAEPAPAEEEEIPFKELLKLRRTRTLQTDAAEYQRVKKTGQGRYNPYLTTPEEKEAEIKGRQPVFEDQDSERFTETAAGPAEENLSVQDSAQRPAGETVPQSPAEAKTEVNQPANLAYKDKETILKESLEFLAKESADWRKKLGYYGDNQQKVLEEKSDFETKKSDLEGELAPVLEQERQIESDIEIIEEEENRLTDPARRRTKEKERWQKEDRRQEIEKKKWAMQADLETIVKLIDDRDRLQRALADKEQEARNRLAEIENEQAKKLAELELLKIRKVKQQIEARRNTVGNELAAVKQQSAILAEKEEGLTKEKRKLEKQEHAALNPAEEQQFESRRWKIEEELRTVERQKWESEDRQAELSQAMTEISGQYDKVVKEEKTVLARTSQQNA